MILFMKYLLILPTDESSAIRSGREVFTWCSLKQGLHSPPYIMRLESGAVYWYRHSPSASFFSPARVVTSIAEKRSASTERLIKRQGTNDIRLKFTDLCWRIAEEWRLIWIARSLAPGTLDSLFSSCYCNTMRCACWISALSNRWFKATPISRWMV